MKHGWKTRAARAREKRAASLARRAARNKAVRKPEREEKAKKVPAAKKGETS